MRRTREEIIAEVQAFCQIPQKRIQIKRNCNLDSRLFNILLKHEIIEPHHKEKSVGRYGAHYYIVREEGEAKDE